MKLLFCLCLAVPANLQGLPSHFHLRAFGQLVIQTFECEDVLGIREGFPCGANASVGTIPRRATFRLPVVRLPEMNGSLHVNPERQNAVKPFCVSLLPHLDSVFLGHSFANFSRMLRLISSIYGSRADSTLFAPFMFPTRAYLITKKSGWQSPGWGGLSGKTNRHPENFCFCQNIYRHLVSSAPTAAARCIG